MKIDQLIYYVEAARQQHVSKAAKILGVSQSTVSHSIAALEDELGRELFRKEGKNIFLTNHGQLLAERAGKIIDEVKRLRCDLVSDRFELQGYYRLGGTHSLVSRYLAPAWNEVKAEGQAIAEVLSFRSAEVLTKIAAGELDLGVCVAPQAHPKVEARVIARGESFVMVREGHALLKRKRAERLAGLVDYDYASAVELQGIEPCRSHPVFGQLPRLRPSYFFDSYEVAASLIRTSDAWALFPEWIARELSGVTRLNDAVAPVTIAAVWPKARVLTPELSRLIQSLEKSF